MAIVLAAYEAVLAGGPTTDELEHAPLLDAWLADMHAGWPVLYGEPTGHPWLTRRMRTSPLLYLDAGRGVARCLSQWYRLARSGCDLPAEAAADVPPDIAQLVERAWAEQAVIDERRHLLVAEAVHAAPARLLKTFEQQVANDLVARLRVVVERWPDESRCFLDAEPTGGAL
jgi:hypothetical protein